MPTRPSFDQPPLRPDDPPFSAWGLWGEEDQVGTLNLIDADAVKRGAGEIRLGLRFSLNWSLGMPKTPGFGRQSCKFTHRVHHGDPNLVTLDDEIQFNTQIGTQIDGLRHFAYQRRGQFYNGHTIDDLTTPGSTTLGIHAWHEQGTIAGRGALIDCWGYAERSGQTYDPAQGFAITYEGLMECLAEQERLSGHPIELQKGIYS